MEKNQFHFNVLYVQHGCILYLLDSHTFQACYFVKVVEFPVVILILSVFSSSEGPLMTIWLLVLNFLGTMCKGILSTQKRPMVTHGLYVCQKLSCTCMPYLARICFSSGQQLDIFFLIFYRRYVNDGRPFWQFIVSSSTGCSDARYFEELYSYYTTEKVRQIV